MRIEIDWLGNAFLKKDRHRAVPARAAGCIRTTPISVMRENSNK